MTLSTYKDYRNSFITHLDKAFKEWKLKEYSSLKFSVWKFKGKTILESLPIFEGWAWFFDYLYRRTFLPFFLDFREADWELNKILVLKMKQDVKDFYFDFDYFNQPLFMSSQFDFINSRTFKVFVHSQYLSKKKTIDQHSMENYRVKQVIKMKTITNFNDKWYSKVEWEELLFENPATWHTFISDLDYESYKNWLNTSIVKKSHDYDEISIEDIPF